MVLGSLSKPPWVSLFEPSLRLCLPTPGHNDPGPTVDWAVQQIQHLRVRFENFCIPSKGISRAPSKALLTR